MTPRYGGPPVLRRAGAAGDPSGPMLRQRRRLEDVLSEFAPAQWAAPTRCDAWSVRDVVAHLVGAADLWRTSFDGGRAGVPTRLFETFDPVTTPPQLVAATRGWSPEETLAQFVAANERLAQTVAGLDDGTWSLTGESPLGHVALHLVAVHALWDSWIHERDIMLPLGLVPDEAPGEVALCLWYAAALGPALRATRGSSRAGVLGVDATRPDVRVNIEIGSAVVISLADPGPDTPVLRGPAVEMIEGLSLRAPLDLRLAPADRWLLTGLGAAFDRA